MRLSSFFQPHQIDRILARAQHEPRDYAILQTFWASGLRTSELRQLLVEDFQADRLFVAHGKGDRQRWVPLAPKAAEAIQAYLSTRDAPSPEAPLFATQHGHPFSRSGLFKLIRSYYHWAGFTSGGPHKLRHSAATHWLNRGCQLPTVQKILGHAHPSTTAVYLHLATEAAFSEYQSRVGGAP